MKKKRRQNDLTSYHLDLRDERIGDIALSLAGHDAGTLLVIVAGIDEHHVLVADGKRRKLSSPKKKKMQHIRILMKLGDADAENIRSGKVNDSFLRKKISEFDIARFT